MSRWLHSGHGMSRRSRKGKNTQAADARIDRIGLTLANLVMKCSRQGNQGSQGSQGSLHDNSLFSDNNCSPKMHSNSQCIQIIIVGHAHKYLPKKIPTTLQMPSQLNQNDDRVDVNL